ncbi:type 4a pilus biogenesis protein PilO [Candidatus Peregrinibacteria bacterium]|nr:type 4a pilus biogenesis protein PilO [Candidatus Peregrinibacteria bacterium]
MPTKSKKIVSTKILKRKTMTFVVLTVLTLGIGGYFGFTQVTEYIETASALDNAENRLEEMRIEESQTENDFIETKNEFNELNTGISEQLQAILPPNEDYTNLVRSLDDFFLNLRGGSDSIFLSDIRFEQPNFPDNAEYAVLPVTMTVSGTEANFDRFLEFIESTGDLNSNNRLMDIQSISINFDRNRNSEEATPENISVSLRVNAYFQQTSE